MFCCVMIIVKGWKCDPWTLPSLMRWGQTNKANFLFQKRLFSFANFTTTIQITIENSYKEKKKKVGFVI